MNPAQRTMFRTVNRLGSWLYRVSNGRLAGKSPNGGSPVLLLTVNGRKSGTPFTVPVAYFPRDGGWVVVGSAGGLEQEPQWFRNLRAASSARVQIGPERHEVSVRILHGDERDAAFAEVLVANSGFADYERKSGRQMPLALLTPRTATV